MNSTQHAKTSPPPRVDYVAAALERRRRAEAERRAEVKSVSTLAEEKRYDTYIATLTVAPRWGQR